jgi:hypothetical protein
MNKEINIEFNVERFDSALVSNIPGSALDEVGYNGLDLSSG